MLTIIEGIDKTGKSTLAAEINKLLGGGAQIIHASKPVKHPLDEYEVDLATYEPAVMEHLILDRWHLGETVWPAIYNRDSLYDDAMHTHVELFLISRGALLILAEGRESAITERITADDYFLPAQVPEILLRFKTAAKRSLLHRVSYDFEREDVDSFAFQVLRAAYGLEYEVSRVHAITSNWIGYPRPLILFVGEQTKSVEANGIPFVPYSTTSGHHLLEAVASSKTFRHPVAFTNALTPSGEPEKLRALWAAMNRPRVVAMGNVAHDALKKLDMRHGVVPHPQYMRRFHHARDFAGMIDRASIGMDTRWEVTERGHAI